MRDETDPGRRKDKHTSKTSRTSYSLPASSWGRWGTALLACQKKNLMTGSHLLRWADSDHPHAQTHAWPGTGIPSEALFSKEDVGATPYSRSTFNPPARVFFIHPPTHPSPRVSSPQACNLASLTRLMRQVMLLCLLSRLSRN